MLPSFHLPWLHLMLIHIFYFSGVLYFSKIKQICPGQANFIGKKNLLDFFSKWSLPLLPCWQICVMEFWYCANVHACMSVLLRVIHCNSGVCVHVCIIYMHVCMYVCDYVSIKIQLNNAQNHYIHICEMGGHGNLHLEEPLMNWVWIFWKKITFIQPNFQTPQLYNNVSFPILANYREITLCSPRLTDEWPEFL